MLHTSMGCEAIRLGQVPFGEGVFNFTDWDCHWGRENRNIRGDPQRPIPVNLQEEIDATRYGVPGSVPRPPALRPGFPGTLPNRAG